MISKTNNIAFKANLKFDLPNAEGLKKVFSDQNPDILSGVCNGEPQDIKHPEGNLVNDFLNKGNFCKSKLKTIGPDKDTFTVSMKTIKEINKDPHISQSDKNNAEDSPQHCFGSDANFYTIEQPDGKKTVIVDEEHGIHGLDSLFKGVINLAKKYYDKPKVTKNDQALDDFLKS
ncbi:MAG: hypothetical protein WCK67_03760 [bacterium]